LGSVSFLKIIITTNWDLFHSKKKKNIHTTKRTGRGTKLIDITFLGSNILALKVKELILNHKTQNT
jgi:hypothetical protein